MTRNPNKKISPTHKRLFFWGVIFFAVVIFSVGIFIRSSIYLQDNSKNTIRILVDRLPNHINFSQHLDVAGRRILPLIDSGLYRVTQYDPLSELKLEPTIPRISLQSRPTLRFIYVADEITRALIFDRGDAEVTYNALNIEKTAWIARHSPASKIVSASGFHLSFLGFNLRMPALQNVEVRKHIAEALPIEHWAHDKWKDWVEPLSQFNFPSYRPKKAFDYFQAHPLPTLTYLTTPVREGLENAQLVREALQNLGLKVEIQMVEPTLFYSLLKQGEYSLFSSRFIRATAEDPVADYLKTNSEKNYFHYSNSSLDEFFIGHPKASLKEVAPWLEKDLPFVPLFNWKHCLILNKRVYFKNAERPILDETFRFLLNLRLESSP